MRTVLLHGAKAAGRVALVDDTDYDLVMQYRWTIWEVPAHNWGPYPVANVRTGNSRIAKLMHQLITGYSLTDHINHDGLDNQRANLRPSTRQQNLANQRAIRGGTSRYKGVTWHARTSQWRARIKVDGSMPPRTVRLRRRSSTGL